MNISPCKSNDVLKDHPYCFLCRTSDDRINRILYEARTVLIDSIFHHRLLSDLRLRKVRPSVFGYFLRIGDRDGTSRNDVVRGSTDP